ncbi:DNA-invertase hin [termite gut metagenome]|uniref:DNA-invertase hin n=1 Tax=termite gut metagenome TaxID=433724 RepID=A0A5J4RTK8_9ZZZZ
MDMERFISYYRVSTQKQGQSGLGLESQKDIVSKYMESEKGILINSYTEVESGKKNDRKELAKALSECKAQNATLIVAKLDRLSRSVSFISSLTDSNVDFTCCDFPSANKFTIHLFASVAQYERELISTRTKAALKAKKEQGFKLGNPHATFTNEMRAKATSMKVEKANTNQNNARAKGMIQKLLQERKTQSEICRYLNANGFQTSTGKEFTPKAVARLIQRYNLK